MAWAYDIRSSRATTLEKLDDADLQRKKTDEESDRVYHISSAKDRGQIRPQLESNYISGNENTGMNIKE